MKRHQSRCGAMALFCFSLCLPVLQGCGGGGGNGGGSSLPLLTGKAYHEIAGGACCHPPVDTPLPSALLTFHLSTGTTEVARVRTNSSGNYSVHLPVGTYEVDLADRSSEPLYNTVNPQQIPVNSIAPNTMDIKFVEDVP